MATERKGAYIPEKILSDPGLGAQHKLVLTVMIASMDDGNVCRLTSQQIGDRLGITKAAAAQSRQYLCRAGWMRLIPKTRSNYKILKIRRKINDD